MASFQCSCGEYLLIPSDRSMLVCWYCRAEYPYHSATRVTVDFEPQTKRVVVKSLGSPVPFFQSRRRVDI